MYRFVLWALLIISILVLAYLAPTLTQPKNISTDDFFPYWAAGKLNLSGENPFDQQNKENLQISVTGHGSTTYPISIMLNPPWAVTMVMPFGVLSYPFSRIAWLIASIGCIVFSAQLNWRLYDGPAKQKWIPWVILLLFAPMISLLEVGQSSAIILLGLSLFLLFTENKQNDWAAGASLVFVAIKPQVTYLVWIAILFWIIQEHRWKVLISSLLTAIILTLIAMIFNTSVVLQYLNMLQTGYLTELATPTLGAYLRYFWLGTDKFWLQFVAPTIGIIWFLWYWNKHSKSWTWLEALPILLLVSQVSAPYTYTYDQIILLPAIIQASIWILRGWKRWSTLIFVVLFITINVLDLILHVKLSDFWFIWLSPSLFIWYLLVRWQYSSLKEKAQIPVLL